MASTVNENLPDFGKHLKRVHFCGEGILRPYPISYCTKCGPGAYHYFRTEIDSFERSLPQDVIDEIMEHQRFLLALGFKLEDVYGKANNKTDSDY
jgi:hypothetical protein